MNYLIWPGSLIKRFVTAKEVANLVTYIASSEASGTTCATLRVDGGLAQSLLQTYPACNPART